MMTDGPLAVATRLARPLAPSTIAPAPTPHRRSAWRRVMDLAAPLASSSNWGFISLLSFFLRLLFLPQRRALFCETREKVFQCGYPCVQRIGVSSLRRHSGYACLPD